MQDTRPKKWPQCLLQWNNTHTSYQKNVTPIQIFETISTQYPNKKAVVYNDFALTYGELNKKANQLANILLSKNLTQYPLIAIMLNRSCEMIVSILAILKIGGTYVPIDPTYPITRISHILENSQA